MAGGGHGGGDGGGAGGILAILGVILLIGVLAYKGAESFFVGNTLSSAQRYESCGGIRVTGEAIRQKDGGCKTYVIVGAKPVTLPSPSSICTFTDEGTALISVKQSSDPTKPYLVKRSADGTDVTVGILWYEKPHEMCDPDNEFWSRKAGKKSAKILK